MTPHEFGRIVKLSTLLDVALTDSEMVLGDKRYYPTSGYFHFPRYDVHDEPDRGQVCAVCLAGAVMAKTLKISVVRDVAPRELASQFGADVENRLEAIDDLRRGRVWDAYERLHQGVRPPQVETDPPEIHSPFYIGEVDFRSFLMEMGWLRDWLVAEGL